jgi:hypothetical protein
MQWDVPKTVTAVFVGWGAPHPAEVRRAEAEGDSPKPPAILNLDDDNLPHEVSAARQLRAALESLAVGARIKVEYLGLKPRSRVQSVTVTNLDTPPGAAV